MPSSSNYSVLHKGHLESSLLSRTGPGMEFDHSTSLVSLELQLRTRHRHILRLSALDRKTTTGDKGENGSEQPSYRRRTTAEPKVQDINGYAKELEQWVKKMKCVTGMQIEQFADIKVGVLECPLSEDAYSIEPYPRLVEGETYKLKGVRDEHGLFKGKATIEFSNGDTIQGFFVKGQRQGECRTETSKNGLSAIIGIYVNDQLCGKAKLLLNSGDWMESYFKTGVLHGFTRIFDARGRLKLIGIYKNGRPCGVWWKMIRGGGCVVGRVNREGELTGYRFAYLYPDFKTALVGAFVDGVLEQAQEARLKTVIDDSGVKVPMFTEVSGPVYKREVATHEFMTNTPLLEDPYERQMVQVMKSNIGGAGDGLYARVDIETNTVVAFYHGRRVRPRDWVTREHETWEDNAYKIFDPNDKKLTIDIPKEYRNNDTYRASYAHKTNHSFMPNAEFVSFDHPRFGLVPCILTTHDIKAGEEIFVHYGYDLQECPQWYEEAWQTGRYPVPDALKRAGYEDNDFYSFQSEALNNGTSSNSENGSKEESNSESSNGIKNGPNPECDNSQNGIKETTNPEDESSLNGIKNETDLDNDSSINGIKDKTDLDNDSSTNGIKSKTNPVDTTSINGIKEDSTQNEHEESNESELKSESITNNAEAVNVEDGVVADEKDHYNGNQKLIDE